MASSSTGRFFSANRARRTPAGGFPRPGRVPGAARIAVARMEGDQVDAQRLYMHVGDAQAHQLFRHHPAGGQDPVEVAVQLADVVVRVGAEPGAHAIAHQQRQVGVVETDHRHVQPTPCVERRPGGEVGSPTSIRSGCRLRSTCARGRDGEGSGSHCRMAAAAPAPRGCRSPGDSRRREPARCGECRDSARDGDAWLRDRCVPPLAGA